MASQILSFDEILQYFKENGGKVKNKDVVRHFKHYLTDPATKDECRRVFKDHVNALAHTKQESGEKVLILKSQYLHSSQLSLNSLNTSTSSLNAPPPPLYDTRNAIGIPTSPLSPATPPRQPPPYRNPPPVVSPSPSVDSVSISSGSLQDDPPRAPPRRRGTLDGSRSDSASDLVHPDAAETEEKEPVSVKERMEKFNRMASSEEELLSPVRSPKSAEKDRNRSRHGDEDDSSVQIPLESKKCQEWYVTASRGDYQELVKLAREEPRLVNKKDPFTAYTVLHWGAKYGNGNIIKTFAGYYKVDVNGKTNGGYTPLHISAQFGHKEIFKLLIDTYKADTKVRDYSGKMAEYYLISKEQKENSGILLRKKDLGFLRIGSLNVRVKKTTEAFSNFLGVGSSGAVNPSDSPGEKMHKGWGSADNVNKENLMGAPKGYIARKRSKRAIDSGLSSTPTTPKAPTKNYSSTSLPLTNFNNDSDSDTAAGFDSNWKN